LGNERHLVFTYGRRAQDMPPPFVPGEIEEDVMMTFGIGERYVNPNDRVALYSTSILGL